MKEDRLDGIPAIHAAPQDCLEDALPTIFLFHGFTSSKELSSYLGYMLARAGFRVLLPEADLHGERFDGDEAKRLTRFWDILKRSIDELPACYESCNARGWVDSRRVGVAGTSMGGFAALGCMVRYDWIKAVASFMGSGYYLDLSRTLYPPLGAGKQGDEAEHRNRMQALAPYDVSAQVERLGGRPLFLWHGEQDDVVPFEESARLRADLMERGLADDLEFLADAKAEHKVTMAAAVAGVDFFSRRL